MNVSEGLSRDGLRLIVWYPLRWLIVCVPVAWGLRILRLMGDLHFSLSRSKRLLLRKNIERMGLAADDHAVREYFRNHYIDRLLIFIFPRFNAGEVDRFVEFKGLHRLDRALKAGSGAVLVHPHFGPVHLPLVSLARLGYRMQQIGLPSDEGLSWVGRNVAFKLRLRYEALIPARIVNADSFLRPVFDWLKSNGVVMITGDGTGTEKRFGKHVELAFNGLDLQFPLGPAMLAGRTGAALIPMFILPGDNKLYSVTIEEPIVVVGTSEDAARNATARFASIYSEYVKKHPGYMHFLDRL